jgi:hypothetical protein
MCKGIHYEQSTYSNQSAQWNQGEKEYHLSGGSSEILFTLKEVNVKIKKYIVGRSVLSGLICQDASILIKGDLMYTWR